MRAWLYITLLSLLLSHTTDRLKALPQAMVFLGRHTWQDSTMCRSRTPSCLSMHAFCCGRAGRGGAPGRPGAAGSAGGRRRARRHGAPRSCCSRRRAPLCGRGRRGAGSSGGRSSRCGGRRAGGSARCRGPCRRCGAAPAVGQTQLSDSDKIVQPWSPGGCACSPLRWCARPPEGACSCAGGRVPAMLGSLPQPWACPPALAYLAWK